MGLSGLGIFHTIIGIATIAGALLSFIKYGKIDLSRLPGKYIFTEPLSPHLQH
ncbi:hypothetical protein [Chryseobacterium proteolyticum]|uniref:hypothetical protein n=1 Tax=Chryseobacterium proteolyticum TaxID=118127 RepID=UPI0039832C95